jgi:hypothetical protein
MKKHPVKLGQRVPDKVAKKALEVIEPAARAGPFFSFRYSSVEMSATGGRTRVKAKTTRLEDGKLTSETFEGDLERPAYDRAVNAAQHYFLDQTALMLKSLSFLLPFSRKQRTDRD